MSLEHLPTEAEGTFAASSSPTVPMHAEHSIEDLREMTWKQEEEPYQNLMRVAESDGHADSVYTVEELTEAFSGAGTLVVTCMDERIVLGDGYRSIAFAGSGILFNDGQFQKFVQQLKRLGVKVVTYHEGCGACGMFCVACKEQGIQTEGPEPEGKKYGTKLSTALGLGAPERIGFHDMKGHPELHHARNVTIDCTGLFNAHRLKTPFPSSFLLSARFYPDVKQVATELDTAIGKIAMGDHGMGQDRFENMAPIAVTLIHDPHAPIDDILSAIQPVLETYGSLVRLVHFRPPESVVKQDSIPLAA